MPHLFLSLLCGKQTRLKRVLWKMPTERLVALMFQVRSKRLFCNSFLKLKSNMIRNANENGKSSEMLLCNFFLTIEYDKRQFNFSNGMW
mmetsp:Transcript_10315/g.18119  ORF Transcript_10315/g.18119 Transcript_10315/m.18119 type:complete len:89 (-) Transcript_10315:13-279(-)